MTIKFIIRFLRRTGQFARQFSNTASNSQNLATGQTLSPLPSIRQIDSRQGASPPNTRSSFRHTKHAPSPTTDQETRFFYFRICNFKVSQRPALCHNQVQLVPELSDLNSFTLKTQSVKTSDNFRRNLYLRNSGEISLKVEFVPTNATETSVDIAK